MMKVTASLLAIAMATATISGCAAPGLLGSDSGATETVWTMDTVYAKA